MSTGVTPGVVRPPQRRVAGHSSSSLVPSPSLPSSTETLSLRNGPALHERIRSDGWIGLDCIENPFTDLGLGQTLAREVKCVPLTGEVEIGQPVLRR